MKPDLADLNAFLAVARAGGFREASRTAGVGASTLSETVRRLEASLGVRLLHRTTRSVTPTEAGARLLERLAPALGEVAAALGAVDDLRDGLTGTLRLNVPVSAARLVLPAILPGFLAAHPGITVEIVPEDGFVDVLASGSDAGIRYDERLEQDMIALPIGPRVQRFATAASPDHVARHGRPAHPRDLLDHPCILGRFASGRLTTPWEFERDGEVIRVEPQARLTVGVGGAIDLGVAAAIAGVGVVTLFEDWLRPHLESGALVPLLEDWWQPFPGPFLYHSSRRLVPPPLRAFIDHVRGTP
ncbi:LysR family transcriptional regulator [Sphingomonas prati]|uniref:DNA-binding transcriptional LysR family regulator n=1 Tax=Sphingomonas prati TaxID=1843237 RepID=A0A7W9BUL0_9SPHN|nr:LysR family transcriptional regulator [Sphingomonas prati]MBB5730401.1 DNA-binding transcriptional LysR family regulator [Sphingomonas prati]GGE93789.1 LysR family transcriptional regulator [Sphingomonas prati]